MRTEQLSVTDMTCNGCVQSVTRALRTVDGVENVTVSLATATATVQFDEQRISIAELSQAVQRAGYDVGEVVAGTSEDNKRAGCCCG